MNFLDESGLSGVLTKLKDKFSLASHTHDDTYYTESEVDSKLNGKAASNHNHDSSYAAKSHTHNYAGSSSVGGSANTAIRLTDNGNHVETASGTTANSQYAGMLYNSGMYMTRTYNDSNMPVTYGNVINLAGSGSGQILAQWQGTDNSPGHLYYRSHRDTSTGGWASWLTILDSNNYNSYAPTKTGTGASGSWGISVTGSSASCTGNAATATTLKTARTITLGGLSSGSASFNGSANITIDNYGYRSKATNGNTNTLPFHLIAQSVTNTGQYADNGCVLMLSSGYQNGYFGIVKIEVRSNSSTQAGGAVATWIIRKGYSADAIQLGVNTTYGSVYADVYLKFASTYQGTNITLLESSNRGSTARSYILKESNETASNTGTNCYASLAAGATALSRTYSTTVTAVDGATVNYANSSGGCTGNAATATKLGTANKGSATQPIYLAAGVPTACTYTLSKSVPSDAKFTDTTYSAATKTTNGLMSSADKSKLDLGGIPIVTTAGTGSAYTATVDGMTSLVNGMKITVIPHTSCTTVYFTLNVNSLGAKSVFRRKFDNSSHMYQGSSNWFESGAPVTLTYNGTAGVWLADATDAGTHDHMASEIRDTIPVSKGGTGATTAAAALTNLGITATAAELNKIDGITATTAELNYCDGVTSNIQTQLNGKSETSHTHSQYAASSHTHSYLPLSGGTLSGTSYGVLNIKNTNANNSSGNASIKFENGNGVLGYIGMDGYADGGLKIYSANTNNTNIILDSSNYYAHIDELSDSGWKNATLSSSFTLYNSSSKVRYRELNKVVHIEGVVKPTATLEGSNDNVTIFTLPSGYRPSSSQYFICQGSGTNRWLMTITSGGVVGFSRYSNGTSNASASTSTWLPFSATFFID